MMSNVIKLIKIGLLTTFRGQVGKKRKIQKPLFAVLMLVAFSPMVFSLVEIIRVMYGSLDMFGQGDSIMALGLLVASMVVFIFGIFYTIGSYYMAQDIPIYLQLPLKPWEISISRFAMVLLYEYLTMLIFFLPVVLGFGIAAEKGVFYYLLSVPVFLMVPILPLSLASMLVITIMSFSKKAINKDRFTMIASLLGLGIGVGFNFGFQSLISRVDNANGFQEMVLSGKISMAENIARFFPGIPNATKALVENNVLHLIIFILVAAVAIILFMLVSKALYFRGVLGINQQVSRRKFDEKRIDGYDSKNPIRTYLNKELKLIFRTPIYFMNLVLIDILLPLFMIIPMFISIGAEQINVIKDQLIASATPGIFIAVSFIVFMFISAMNGITATSISREGKQIYMMKYLPISYTEQLNAKLLSGMVVSSAGMILLVVILTIFLEISIPIAMLMLLSGFNAVILTRLTGMYIDAANPKLKWDNEQKAVKQNMNLVFNMLIGMGVAGLAVIFIIFAGQSLLLNSLVFIVGMAFVNGMIYKLLSRSFPRMIERIE
ncbi:MAG: hypothetical protein JXN10_09555 [Clostridia bacterium]|nr:hypothetical protein [Clostridia bacterium]